MKLNCTRVLSWIAPAAFGLCCSAPIGCGSNTSSPGGGGGGATSLSIVGDDCISDSQCASGLCDNNGSCATPVATNDGNPCTADTDCPAGDQCDATTAQCFSAAKDGTGAGLPCATDADCAGDESCGTDGHCQG